MKLSGRSMKWMQIGNILGFLASAPDFIERRIAGADTYQSKSSSIGGCPQKEGLSLFIFSFEFWRLCLLVHTKVSAPPDIMSFVATVCAVQSGSPKKFDRSRCPAAAPESGAWSCATPCVRPWTCGSAPTRMTRIPRWLGDSDGSDDSMTNRVVRRGISSWRGASIGKWQRVRSTPGRGLRDETRSNY